VEIYPVVNSWPEGEAYHRFVIEPKDYLTAERLAISKGLDIIGTFHSHPDSPAVPSAYDLENGQPFFSSVIVSVTQGKAEAPLSWVMENDRSKYIQEEVLTV